MITNWGCTVKEATTAVGIICLLLVSLGDGQWKYYKQENAHTVSVLSHPAKVRWIWLCWLSLSSSSSLPSSIFSPLFIYLFLPPPLSLFPHRLPPLSSLLSFSCLPSSSSYLMLLSCSVPSFFFLYFLLYLSTSPNLPSAWLQCSELGTCCQSWLPRWGTATASITPYHGSRQNESRRNGNIP